jgi:MSHA pilin protein MshC
MVELIVVILIAGILSFYAMGQFGNMGDVNAQGFADQVASTVRFAQKAAVAQRRLVYVNVNAASKHVFACLDAAVPCATPLLQPAGGALDITGAASLQMTATSSQFSFNGFGTPSQSTAIQLVTTGSSGQQFTVTIKPDTGYVQRS